jgi:DNA-binding IclR family transcriptional regulator
MAMSENSIKVLNYLKEIHGTNVTSADVAEALDLGKSTVNGVFTALQKKGYGVRVDATVPGTAEISALSVTAEGEACEKAEMSDMIKAIFEYLAANKGNIVTLDDMATALNADKRVVNGSFNSLVRKGFAARTPVTVEAEVAVKYLVLTDEGLALDPTAEA